MLSPRTNPSLSCNNSNETLAVYLERTWPNQFPLFCRALRQYPMPIVSAAAATFLQGSSRDALLALDAYFTSHTAHKDGDVGMVSDVERSRMRLVPSFPFRCVGVCASQHAFGLPSLLAQYELNNDSSAPTNSKNHNHTYYHHHSNSNSNMSLEFEFESDRHESTNESEDLLRLRVADLRVKCAALGLLTSGTKRDLLARLRQQRKVQLERTSPVSPLSAALQRSQRMRTPFRSPTPETPEQQEGQRQKEIIDQAPTATSGNSVGTPQQFVAALLLRRRRDQRQRGDTATSSAATTTTTTSTTNGAIPALGTDASLASHPMWFLVVDNRERLRGGHEQVLETLTQSGVDARSATLPCGDFMFATSTTYGTDHNKSGNDQFQLLPVVVERKTVRDLCASIAGSRYYEQRRLLSSSPFPSIIWLVEGTLDALRPDERRRVLSACASLASRERFRVVRTRHVSESMTFLKHLGSALVVKHQMSTQQGTIGTVLSDGPLALERMTRLKQTLRAVTTFPRMLMCVRGCSSGLAVQLATKYGSMLRLWQQLRQCGRDACDADEDIQRLSTTQKEVYVRLTEFLLTEEYC